MGVLASELKKIFAEDIAANNSISEGLLVKLGSTLNSVIDNHLWQLGDVRPSALTETQFAAQNGYSLELPMAQRRWVRIEGQSVDGSAFTALTGIKTLPNALAYGAHLEQVKSIDSLLQYFASQNKAHTHVREIYSFSNYNSNGALVGLHDSALPANTDWSVSSGPPFAPRWINRGVGSYDRLTYEGGSVARPNSVTVNFFIKINN